MVTVPAPDPPTTTAVAATAPQSGRWRALSERLSAAGRMAFSNYLGTSILCTLFFNGYGLGWFGFLERWQLYGVVAIVWMGGAFCMLAFTSNFWLALVFVFVIGFTASAIRVSSMTLLQYSVEPHMRGRVASIYGMITHFGPALGAVMVGFLGDRLGLPLIMGAIGLFTLAVWLWAFARRDVIATTLEADVEEARR